MVTQPLASGLFLFLLFNGLGWDFWLTNTWHSNAWVQFECRQNVAFPGLFDPVCFGGSCSPKFVSNSEVTRILWKDLACGFMWVCWNIDILVIPFFGKDGEGIAV